MLVKAKKDNIEYLALNSAVEDPMPEDIKMGLTGLELMVRLLSIKDQFERWETFTNEMSKVWPDDVTAVDAAREQRN